MRPGQKWQLAKQQYALGELDNVGLQVAAMVFRAGLQVGRSYNSQDYLPTVSELIRLPQALGSGHALQHAEDPDALKDAMG